MMLLTGQGTHSCGLCKHVWFTHPIIPWNRSPPNHLVNRPARRRRWFAQHAAFFYFFVVVVLYIANPRNAYNLNQVGEE